MIQLNHAQRSTVQLALAFGAGLFVVGMSSVLLIMVYLFTTLPDLASMSSYHPKMPLRVFSADHVLLAEFGDERRIVTPLRDIPLLMQQALLAIEDQHFYEHDGIYLVGNFRALLHNLTNFGHGPKQGASTITQQVARNFFLTNEQTYQRKIIEALLTLKIEHHFSKARILELYMNQIYLGQHAYGFASAAQIYFGKKLADLTPAEAAMLAGLPKSPARVNPISNFARATARQLLVLKQMRQMNVLTELQYQQARIEPLQIKNAGNEFGVHAEFVAELAREAVQERFKDTTTTRGINVYTTILKDDQVAAYQALRQGVMDYVRRHGYHGPEGFAELPDNDDDIDDMLETAFAQHPADDDLLSAVVLQASAKKVMAVTSDGEDIMITGAGLNFAAASLIPNAKNQIRRGAIIRVQNSADRKFWSITEEPEIEASLVSADTNTGAIHALVGGFSFRHNQFNHVTQAWRQPGSTFKPFIYSAALEQGLTPATLINDQPLSFDATTTGGKLWEPKNAEDEYDGPMTMRDALAKSKNMVSIQILEQIGVGVGQQYAMRFGFDPAKNPANLPLALGAGAVTPLQLAAGYASFANGGFKINPYFISKVTDANGSVLMQPTLPQPGLAQARIISQGNAFMMDSMLKTVIKSGTATKALSLNRSDIAGKTGTTNNAIDAWFAGYQNRLVAVAWVGFDQPKNLGSTEFGGGLALPIWIKYMQTALQKQPVEDRLMPATVMVSNGDYTYVDPPHADVPTIGLEPPTIPDLTLQPITPLSPPATPVR